MPRILLYEFLTSGGLWSLPPRASDALAPLLPQGRAMLAAVATDFAALSNFDTLVLRDARWHDATFPGCRVEEISSAEEERTQIEQLSRAVDGVLLIAPECDGLLLERARWVIAAGGTLLGPAPELIALAADKFQTNQWLQRCGLPLPQAWLQPEGIPFPLVMKPRYGVGSDGIRLVRDVADLDLGMENSAGEMVFEQFMPGTPASVSLLCGPNETRPLIPSRQHLSGDSRFKYNGGSLPLPSPLVERATLIAHRVASCFQELRGYIGIDMVLGDASHGSQDAVIEVNPRLTTSYIGLRAAVVRGNLAAAMWDIAHGLPTDLMFGAEAIQFDAEGKVAKPRAAGGTFQ